jgi:hypothetical protein
MTASLWRDLTAFGVDTFERCGWDLYSMTVDVSETWTKYDKASPNEYRAIARGRVVLQVRDSVDTVRGQLDDVHPSVVLLEEDERATYVNLRLSVDLGRELPVVVEVCADLAPAAVL